MTTSEEDASNGEDLQEEFRLKDISLEFPENELSLVVGPVASGKSTLILSLLGETTLIAGKINMPGDLGDNSLIPLDPQTGLKYGQVAYCPQQPFLIHASIRDNILWGTPYDEVRYKTVVHCCALERDLEIWSNGENTIVGEEGTVCSGGQKARIALARAVYSRASILLLDVSPPSLSWEVSTAEQIFYGFSSNRTFYPLSIATPQSTFTRPVSKVIS